MAGANARIGKDEKGKGKEKEGKKKVEGKAGEGKRAKTDGEGGKSKAAKKDKANGKGGKGKPEDGESAVRPISPTKSTSQSTPVAHSAPDPKPRGEKRKGDQDAAPKSKKQKKREQKQAEGTQVSTGTEKQQPEPETGMGALTALQSSMKSNLEGARFRFINEQLYKSSSDAAQELMRQDPQVYAEYHTGFRHQTKSWPKNPVKLIASSLSSLPPRSLIADLGCGDAELAKTLVPEGLNVLSFDLVSDGAWVVQADICTRLPLPGSEKGEEGGEQAIVDACVCSLSLMSTNWVGCAREAWRVLRSGGRFVVAEVTSRFKDTEAFTKLLSELGFELIEQTAPSTHFLLFEFRKVARDEDVVGQEWERIRESADTLLKPCEYKRR
ncbi:hypothetical protein BDV93DRAFT_452330 [Ceratobasidium sp. AG-I]|nr:hypothetical protein BDV93DRAFT_452330 [Ceratobasidium sp. AG-I]